MSDCKDLNRLIKRSAVEAVEAGKPVNIVFGKVTSASPLKILVDQKMTLGAAQLVLTRNVTTFTVSETVDHITENTGGGSGDASFASHNHAYKGTKSFTIHNALKAGEEVVLIRMQGGQKFIVIDRLG